MLALKYLWFQSGSRLGFLGLSQCESDIIRINLWPQKCFSKDKTWNTKMLFSLVFFSLLSLRYQVFLFIIIWIQKIYVRGMVSNIRDLNRFRPQKVKEKKFIDLLSILISWFNQSACPNMNILATIIIIIFFLQIYNYTSFSEFTKICSNLLEVSWVYNLCHDN